MQVILRLNKSWIDDSYYWITYQRAISGVIVICRELSGLNVLIPLATICLKELNESFVKLSFRLFL